MKLFASIIALACCAHAVAWGGDFAELPVHARGGEAHRQLTAAAEAALVRADGSMPKPPVTTAQIFKQKIVHSGGNGDTFDQRYYVDSQFYGGAGSPLVINLCGEGPCTRSPAGYVQQVCQGLQAMCVSLEHRFYGESIPYGNLDNNNILTHLTIENALLDAKAFLEFFKANQTITGKVLVVGGSYPGGLASFMRTAYPDTVDAAWASSGVVFPKIEFPEFDEAIAGAISPQCADSVRLVTAAFEEATNAGGQARADAMNLFGADMDKLWDPDFYYMMADSAAMAVQYSNKQWLCDAMQPVPTLSTQKRRELFANFTVKYWGASFPHDCFYDTSCLNSTDPNTQKRWQPTARSWRAQKCSEVAWWQIAPAQGSLRSQIVDLQYHIQQCRYIFSDPNMPLPSVGAVNAKYGGLQPQSKGATKIYSANFGDDPWRMVCLRDMPNPELPAFVAPCDGCGHCDDLRQPKSSDPDALLKQRVMEMSYFTQWMK